MAKHKPEPKTRKAAGKRHHHDGRPCELRTLEHIIGFVLELESQIMALDQTVTDALAAQDKKISDLSASVDAFIASHQSNSAADNAAIVAAVQAQGSAVDTIAAKLTPPA
jgi:hypothetical protein